MIITGVYRVKFTSASSTDLIQHICNAGIDLQDVLIIDALSVAADVKISEIKQLHLVTDKYGAKLEIIQKKGAYFTLFNLLKRPVLVIGMLLLVILSVYLPTRVLFVEVEGNQNVPARLILEQAEECGIRFGASRKEVRSERVKNALLGAMPQLQWSGVNTYGCVAVITVRERTDNATDSHSKGISSIIAARDGIIQQITVTRGNPLCRVGQAVRAGQLLVSGYTDCGLSIRAEKAEAEIYANTFHTLTCLSPTESIKREAVVGEKTALMLQIGKNIIKFCKDSGISDTTCVKMYEKMPLVLPGGFSLPVSLIKVRQVFYDTALHNKEDADAYSWLDSSARAYLLKQIPSGKILEQEFLLSVQNGLCKMDSRYACYEMIGKVRNEELSGSYG